MQATMTRPPIGGLFPLVVSLAREGHRLGLSQGDAGAVAIEAGRKVQRLHDAGKRRLQRDDRPRPE